MTAAGVAETIVHTVKGDLPLMHDDIDLDMEYFHLLLREGVSLAFDLFGWEDRLSDCKRCRRIAALAAEGYADRVLLFTDLCRLSQLHTFGGHGFGCLFTKIVPSLRGAGIASEDISFMIIHNPARLFSIEP